MEGARGWMPIFCRSRSLPAHGRDEGEVVNDWRPRSAHSRSPWVKTTLEPEPSYRPIAQLTQLLHDDVVDQVVVVLHLHHGDNLSKSL